MPAPLCEADESNPNVNLNRANINMHPWNLSRIRNCRKSIWYAYTYFPNFLASLLCCTRNRLCSVQQLLLLSLLPSWAGPWCLVILAGSPGSPCALKLYSWETSYPAPVTLQLLIADCGLSSFLAWIHCISVHIMMRFQFMGLHSWN